MSISRRTFMSLVAGGMALPAAAANASAEPFLLEDFFVGHTRGTGLFVSGIAGVRRGFSLDAVGTVDGSTLILREFIRYDDGLREEAVWRFLKTGVDSYQGQRTGVTGVVPIRTRNGGLEMSYVAAVKGTDGGTTKLRFTDRLVRIDQKTVLNTADVSFLGIPVGTVEVTFRR